METKRRPGGGRERVEVVFFDVGGTLLHVRPSVGHVYADAARRLGHPVDPESVNRGFRGAWKRSLSRRRAMNYLTTDKILREEWRTIVAESFDGLLPGHLVGRAFEELYEHFAGPRPWSLAEGAKEVLEDLRREGLRLGLLSNWDSRIHPILEEFGVDHLFELKVVSYDVGVEKPHPEIFKTAERKAGVPPGSLLLVGDSLEQDIQPALDSGWRAIWLEPERTPEADSGLEDLERASDFSEIAARIRTPWLPDGSSRTSGS